MSETVAMVIVSFLAGLILGPLLLAEWRARMIRPRRGVNYRHYDERLPHRISRHMSIQDIADQMRAENRRKGRL